MLTHDALWDAIERIAARRRWTVSRLATTAGLDPTALNRSKRQAADGQPRWPSSGTLAKVLKAANITLSEFARIVEDGELNRDATDRGHLLLVDDDDLFRQASAERLRAARFKVYEAPGHRHALDLIDDGCPLDLLCTDIVMPEGMGGVALARLARARVPDLKVAYVTGYDIALPGDANIPVLRKPIRPDDLVSLVDRMISPRQQAAG